MGNASNRMERISNASTCTEKDKLPNFFEIKVERKLCREGDTALARTSNAAPLQASSAAGRCTPPVFEIEMCVCVCVCVCVRVCVCVCVS